MPEFYCHPCVRILGRVDLDRPYETKEALYQHIEKEHHIMIRREHETFREAQRRFLVDNPQASCFGACECERCENQKKYQVQKYGNN